MVTLALNRKLCCYVEGFSDLICHAYRKHLIKGQLCSFFVTPLAFPPSGCMKSHKDLGRLPIRRDNNSGVALTAVKFEYFSLIFFEYVKSLDCDVLSTQITVYSQKMLRTIK